MPATLTANSIQIYEPMDFFQTDAAGDLKVRVVYRIGSYSGGIFTPLSSVRVHDYVPGTTEVPGTMYNNALNAAATAEGLTLSTASYDTISGAAVPASGGSGTDTGLTNTTTGYFS